MKRRIYGEENELGAICRDDQGHWSSAYGIGVAFGPLLQEIYNSVIKYSTFMPNGGQLRSDVGHVEISTPEASLARDLVLASKGFERFVEDAFPKQGGKQLVFLKDNTDSKTDLITFGCHENYLVQDKWQQFLYGGGSLSCEKNFLANFFLFLMSRIIVVGGGVISTQFEDEGCFYLSHRARFLDKETDNSSTGSTPLVGTKNESLSSGDGYFRIHLPIGDPVMSEFAQYMKYGMTGLFLRLAEEQKLPFLEVGPEDTIGTMKAINGDLSLKKVHIRLSDGRKLRPLHILDIFMKRAKACFPKNDDPEDVAKETLDILKKWEEVRHKLEKGPDFLNKELDYQILRKLMEKRANKDGISLSDLPELFRKDSLKASKILLDLKYLEQRYHELSPQGLYRIMAARGLVRRIVSDKEIEIAKNEPPGFNNPAARTRSWARGKIVQKARARERKVSVDWDKVTVHSDESGSGFKLISLGDPFTWDNSEIRSIIADLDN